MPHLFDVYVQPVSSAGVPLSGATLTFYSAGTTSPITIYQDAAMGTPHLNPVTADAAGLFAPIWVNTASYKFVLKTSAGVTVQTVDNIQRVSVTTSSTLNAVAKFSNTTGAIESSAVTIDGNNDMVIPGDDFPLTLRWTDATALAGPRLVIDRLSATPTANDALGEVRFRGRDSAGNVTDYVNIGAVLGDPVNGTEDGYLFIETMRGGTLANRFNVADGLAAAGVTGGDQGAGTGNFTGLFINGGSLKTSPGFLDSVLIQRTDDTSASGPTLSLERYSTTPAASDNLGQISWQFQNSVGDPEQGCRLALLLTDPDAASEDTRLQFQVMIGGSLATRFNMTDGFWAHTATGGDKGAGTINAVAVYDDNVLLTCYPFDAYLDGRIDDAKWDAKVPDRIHPAEYDEVEEDTGKKDKDGKPILRKKRVEREPEWVEVRQHDDMRKFKARLGTETDPLDLEKYIAHWKDKRHLSSLPNEANFDTEQGMPIGAWLQRVLETVEIQAIHISQLHDRLKAAGL